MESPAGDGGTGDDPVADALRLIDVDHDVELWWRWHSRLEHQLG